MKLFSLLVVMLVVMLVAILVIGPSLLAQTTAPAIPVADRSGADGVIDYIRYLDEGPDSERLQTAVVRFEKGGAIVDLVGVVHLGDADYFQNLNEILKQYDVVLYEMVGGKFKPEEDPADAADAAEAPAASAASAAPQEMSGVRSLQNLGKSILGLEFQMDGIDYTAPNFLHADVEWSEFNELMQARNQSFATLFTRAMALAEEGDVAGVPTDEEEIAAMMKKLFSAVMSGNSNELKRTIAPLISEAEGFITQLEGEDGTVLVSERNRIVIEKLNEVRQARGEGRYAIFYGAGHMPDLEERLIAGGFRKGGTIWADAWTIHESVGAATAPGGSPAELLMKLISENPEIMSSIQQLGTMLEDLGGAVKSLPPPPPVN